MTEKQPDAATETNRSHHPETAGHPEATKTPVPAAEHNLIFYSSCGLVFLIICVLIAALLREWISLDTYATWVAITASLIAAAGAWVRFAAHDPRQAGLDKLGKAWGALAASLVLILSIAALLH